MKEKLPTIEEGKEPTEEQIKEVNKLKGEYTIKKLKQFDAYMKEREPLVFNNNVFKKAQLVMSEDDIKKEEEKVINLSKYILENAIPNMIKNFNKSEGTPTDSASMRDFFH